MNKHRSGFTEESHWQENSDLSENQKFGTHGQKQEYIGLTRKPLNGQQSRNDDSSSKQADDGTAGINATDRRRKEGDSTLSRDSSQRQTSLLIEYLEGGKGSSVDGRRPSVRVKVTPSSKNRSKSNGEHIQTSKTRHGDRERSSRRGTSSAYSKRDSKRDRITDLDGQSVSPYASQTEESNVPRNLIDIEVRPPRGHGSKSNIGHIQIPIQISKSHKAPTKASTIKEKHPGDEASLLERLGHPDAPQAEQQDSGGARGRNENSNDQMSLNTWRDNLLEEENRNKLAKAEQEYQQQLDRLVAFESDGTHWSGTGQRLDVVEENLEVKFRRELSEGDELNAGTFGTVRKVVYRKVTLAVKEMRFRWLSRYHLARLMETSQVPVFGICLGHQLLALASGARTIKLKYGNRAHNIPALDLTTRQCHITFDGANERRYQSLLEHLPYLSNSLDSRLDRILWLSIKWLLSLRSALTTLRIKRMREMWELHGEFVTKLECCVASSAPHRKIVGSGCHC